METAKVAKIIVVVMPDGRRVAEYENESDSEEFTDSITLPNCRAYTANVAIISRKPVADAQKLAEAVEAKLPEFQNFSRSNARNEINTIIGKIRV